MTRRLDTQARRASRLPRMGNLAGFRAQRNGLCHLCGTKVALDEASRDHLVPIVNGGPRDRHNIDLAHKDCNVARDDMPLPLVREALALWSQGHPGCRISHRQAVEVLRSAARAWRAQKLRDMLAAHEG